MINVIADLHIDHHIGRLDYSLAYYSEFLRLDTKLQEHIRWLVKSYIDECISNTSKLAEGVLLNGDISNYNTYSIIAIEYLLQIFKRVYVVFGNHEFYLSYPGREYRTVELVDYFKESNVVFLDKLNLSSSIIYHEEDIRFSGASCLYDMSNHEVRYQYKHFMNDSKFISEETIDTMNKYSRAIYSVTKDYIDIFFSHVPVVPLSPAQMPSTYYTDIGELSSRPIHIAGHTHETFNIKRNYNGIKCANLSIGYPNHRNKNVRKFYVVYKHKGDIRIK